VNTSYNSLYLKHRASATHLVFFFAESFLCRIFFYLSTPPVCHGHDCRQDYQTAHVNASG
jgi:hypothetical protein